MGGGKERGQAQRTGESGLLYYPLVRINLFILHIIIIGTESHYGALTGLEVTMQMRLAWNSQSSCLSLPTARLNNISYQLSHSAPSPLPFFEPVSCYVAQAGDTFLVLLPLSPEDADDRHVLACTVLCIYINWLLYVSRTPPFSLSCEVRCGVFLFLACLAYAVWIWGILYICVHIEDIDAIGKESDLVVLP